MKRTWMPAAALTAALAAASATACSMIDATAPGAVAPGAAAPNANATAAVKVWKSRGAVQCGSAGTPPERMARELEAAGIAVLAQACGSDGRLYAAVCGGADGRINIFTIPADRLQQAAALQLQPLTTLPDAQETGCT